MTVYAAGKMVIIGKRMNLTPDLLLLFLGLCLSRSCNDPALGTTQGLIASGDHHREAKERCCHQGERKRPRHVQDQRLQSRVSHITPFFELSYTLLTTHAIGLYI